MEKQYPLKGKTVVVTRSLKQNDEFIYKLENLGAGVISFPVIEIKPINISLLISSLKEIKKYDWIIFTSANTVDIFFKSFFTLYSNLNNLQKIKVAVVGEKTALQLKKNGLVPDLIPVNFVADSLIEEFEQIELKDKKILFPVASLAKSAIPEKLGKIGAVIDTIPVYDTVLPESYNLAVLKKTNIDYLTFTSSSTVTNFHKIVSENNYTLSKNTKIVSIGPVTSDIVKELFGISPLEAVIYTVDGIIEKIIEDTKK